MIKPGDFGALYGGDPGESMRKRAEARWKADVWKKLARCYNEPYSVIAPIREEDDKNNAEDAIRITCASDEMSKMYTHKANVNLQDLVLRPMDNPAIKALLSLETQWWTEGAGVIFPVSNYGDWILHTFGHRPGSMDGKALIVIYAKKAEDRDIIAEPLSQFISSRNV